MNLVDLFIKIDLNVSPQQLNKYAEDAYELAEKAKSFFVDIQDPQIHIWVEQGSLSFKAKIAIGAATTVTFLAQFDGALSGLERLNNYSKRATSFIATQIIEHTPGRVLETKNAQGVPEKILKIFKDVERGKITAEQGTNKVIKLFDSEKDSIAKEAIINSIRLTADKSYKHPDEFLLKESQIRKQGNVTFDNQYKSSIKPHSAKPTEKLNAYHMIARY